VQEVQTVAPVAAAYVPEAQLAHVPDEVAARASEAVPAGQLKQLLPPSRAENVPARHCVQSLEPVAAATKPRAQFTHALAVDKAWYLPLSQAVHASAPAPEYNPAVQLAQLVWPKRFWCVPAAQLVQPLAPAAEYVDAAQLSQTEELDSPVVADEVPASQFLQLVEAKASVYVPAPQLRQ